MVDCARSRLSTIDVHWQAFFCFLIMSIIFKRQGSPSAFEIFSTFFKSSLKLMVQMYRIISMYKCYKNKNEQNNDIVLLLICAPGGLLQALLRCGFLPRIFLREAKELKLSHSRCNYLYAAPGIERPV